MINLITQKISRLKVFFYHLAWTARHKGGGAAARFLAQRLGFRKSENRDGCGSSVTSPAAFGSSLSRLANRPRFTLIVTAGGEPDAVQTTLNSFQTQLYPPHQIILIAGVEAEGTGRLTDLRSRYPLRIQHTEDSDLLSAVEGDFFCVIFPGDMLTEDALGQAAIAASTAQNAALIYADEDQRLPDGRRGRPLLKPDWSPDFLLSTDYIGRAVFFNQKWAEKAGGIDLPCGRATLYDLALRITEIGPSPIHLPRILLTRSTVAFEDVGSEFVIVIKAALQRRGLVGAVSAAERSDWFLSCPLPATT